jgi:hypothetical protein
MIEIIGWIATAGTLLSFAVKDMWKLRLINSIASVVWIVYALLKLDYPILVINTSVILMHLYWFYTNRKGLGVGGESLKENFIDSKIKQMNKPKVTIDELHTFLTNVIELKVGIRRKIVALKDFINKIESDSSPNSLESPNTSASVDSSDKRDIDFMYKWIRKHSNK